MAVFFQRKLSNHMPNVTAQHYSLNTGHLATWWTHSALPAMLERAGYFLSAWTWFGKAEVVGCLGLFQED